MDISVRLLKEMIWFGNEYLDAVGGRDDATELSTAERYNPKTNQWSPVVAMNSRRSGVRLIKKEKLGFQAFIDRLD
jgi:hypothetical protein